MPRLKIEDILMMDKKRTDALIMQWDIYYKSTKDESCKQFLLELKEFVKAHEDAKLDSLESRISFQMKLNSLLADSKKYSIAKAGDSVADRAMKSHFLKLSTSLEKDMTTVLDSISAQTAHNNLKVVSSKEQYVKAYNALDSMDPATVINSSEFRGVKNALKDINKLLKKAKDPVSHEQLEKMSSYCERINNLSEGYIEMKNAKLQSGKPLNSLEQQRLKAMQVLQKSFSQHLRKVNEALGRKTITSAEKADEFNKKADELLSREQLKEKPDKKLMYKAVALKKYAEQLKAKPEGHIYNSSKTEKNLKSIMSAIDFKKVADKEIENLGARYAQEAYNRKEEMLNPSTFFGDDFNKKIEDGAGRFGLSVGRGAMNMLATAHMLRKGYSLKEIFDPNQLKNERLEAGFEVMDIYENMSDVDFKSWVAENIHDSLILGMAEMNSDLAKMPEITGRALNQPQNSYMHPALVFMQNLGQEYSRDGIKDTIYEMYGKDAILGLVDEQMGLSVPLSNITSGQMKAVEMMNVKPEDAQIQKLQENISVLFSMAVVEKSLSNMYKPGVSKETFSQTFNRRLHPVTSQEIMTTSGFVIPNVGDFATKLSEILMDNMQVNVQNLGREILNGNLFTKNDVTKFEQDPKTMNRVMSVKMTRITAKFDSIARQGAELQKSEEQLVNF